MYVIEIIDQLTTDWKNFKKIHLTLVIDPIMYTQETCYV